MAPAPDSSPPHPQSPARGRLDGTSARLAALTRHQSWTTALTIVQVVLIVLLGLGLYLEQKMPGVLELLSRDKIQPLMFYLALGIPIQLLDLVLAGRERAYAVRLKVPNTRVRRAIVLLSYVPAFNLLRNTLVLAITLLWFLVLGCFLVGWFLLTALLAIPALFWSDIKRAQGQIVDALDEGLSEATTAMRSARKTVTVSPLFSFDTVADGLLELIASP